MTQENDMFTYAEASELLLKWGITNIEERLKNDRKQLLDKLAQALHENIAFQSITMMAITVEERKFQPSFDEIKARCTSGVGGVCCELAPFTYYLLKALGFFVQMVTSTVTSTMTAPGNHAFVLVYGLENKRDIHIVDCGTGFATFRAVSLNFLSESPIFRDSFLEYKYIRHDGKILRMHGEGDRFKRNNPPIEGLDFFMDRWRRFYSFEPDQQLSEMSKPNEMAYRTVADGLTPFTSSPRAIWFPRKRAVAIVDNKLIIESEAGKLVTTVLKSDEEILKAYSDHFPQLKQEAVRKALAEWRRLSKS